MAESQQSRWNMKSPAVRRILQEIRELQQEESTEFIAEAMEDDIFEFAFVVRGPPDTEFEGGLYHGRILLPAEYPFKPPSFLMLTPSGRFQTNVKICLSISSHHPEHWQPSWSVRTALTALVAFMPSPGAGALGSLDYSKDERRQLAAKSRAAAPKVGSAARQRVVDSLHARMLEMEQRAAAAGPNGGGSGSAEAPAAALERMRAEIEAAKGSGSGGISAAAAGAAPPAEEGSPVREAAAAAGAEASAGSPQHQEEGELPRSRTPEITSAADASPPPQLRRRAAPSAPSPTGAAPAWAAAAAAGATPQQLQHQLQQQRRGAVTPAGSRPGSAASQFSEQGAADRGLTLLAVVLSLAIAAVLLKKLLALGGGGRVDAFAFHSA